MDTLGLLFNENLHQQHFNTRLRSSQNPTVHILHWTLKSAPNNGFQFCENRKPPPRTIPRVVVLPRITWKNESLCISLWVHYYRPLQIWTTHNSSSKSRMGKLPPQTLTSEAPKTLQFPSQFCVSKTVQIFFLKKQFKMSEEFTSAMTPVTLTTRTRALLSLEPRHP